MWCCAVCCVVMCCCVVCCGVEVMLCGVVMCCGVAGRSGASSGVWLVVLVPLACLPGLYTTYNECQPVPHLQALLAIQVTLYSVRLGLVNVNIFDIFIQSSHCC